MTKQKRRYVLYKLLLIVLVLILGVLALGAGLMIGYGVIGQGSDMWAILSPAKWQELLTKFTGR